MKRLVLAATVVISLAGIGSIVSAQEGTGPKVLVDQLNHHFGKVVQGEQAEYVFEMRSVGKEALVIDRIQSS